MDVIEINPTLEWKALRTQGGTWVAACDAIGLTVSADNYSDLLASISEALQNLFQDLKETGDVGSFFAERGISTSELPLQPALDIPFEVCLTDPAT